MFRRWYVFVARFCALLETSSPVDTRVAFQRTKCWPSSVSSSPRDFIFRYQLARTLMRPVFFLGLTLPHASLQHNEGGRGCELSELVLVNRHLLAFDDRTGIMFEITNFEDSGVPAGSATAPALVPRQLFMEGDGTTDKGLKIEWATSRDGLLYIGSFGKEFTDNSGNIVHSNNLWVATVSDRGVIAHANWKGNYDAMRDAMGYAHPAYLLHEAITWSPHHKQWFVLPRRMSKSAYDEVVDEGMGANTIIRTSPDFKSVTRTTVGVRLLTWCCTAGA